MIYLGVDSRSHRFNIHGKVVVCINNDPGHGFLSVISNEMRFFESEKTGDQYISVNFKRKIQIPHTATQLIPGLHVDNSKLYLKRSGKILEYDVSQILRGKLNLSVEAGYDDWGLYWILEKTVLTMCAAGGLVPVHGCAFTKGKEAVALLSLEGFGKTDYIIENCSKGGASFLGDDIILFSQDGMCHAFPRRINIKPYSKFYKFAISNSGERSWEWLKSKMRRLIYPLERQKIYRLRLGEILPGCLTVARAPLGTLMIHPYLKLDSQKNKLLAYLDSIYKASVTELRRNNMVMLDVLDSSLGSDFDELRAYIQNASTQMRKVMEKVIKSNSVKVYKNGKFQKIRL